jgi:Baseplate J-like protein
MAPQIDSRSYDDIVAKTAALAMRYAGWQPPGLTTVPATAEQLIGSILGEDLGHVDPDDPTSWPAIARGTPIDAALADQIVKIVKINGTKTVTIIRLPDAGAALIGIFARMAEQLIERLNRAPDKNFLAFLNMLGAQALPPQPARVPLTFQLAAGSTAAALVPARTQVGAAPATGDPGPVNFETERELVLSSAQLVAAYTRQPARDRFGDWTAIVTGQAVGSFSVFEGDDAHPTTHRLYLGNAGQFGIAANKDITLSYTPPTGDGSWLAAVQWAYWDGTRYQPVTVTVGPNQLADEGQITFGDVPAIPSTAIGGWSSRWLCGTLLTALPVGDPIAKHDQQPIAGFSGAAPIDFSGSFYPFGNTSPAQTFYLACDPTYAQPRTLVTISISIDSVHPGTPSADLVLAWEYSNGPGESNWQLLGKSSPTYAVAAGSPAGFADCTGAFTLNSAISFVCPADWVSSSVNGVKALWLRAGVVAGNYGTSPYQPPAVSSLSLGYDQPQLQFSSIQTSINIAQTGLAPDMAFANQTPVDLSKDFYPFGQQPQLSDTFYLASDTAFSIAGAGVTMYVTLTHAGLQKDGVALIWEFWDGGQWQTLGDSIVAPVSIPSVTTYSFNDQTNAFTNTDAEKTAATVTFTCPPIRPVAVNGQLHYWIRVRIAGGDYGQDATYTPVCSTDLTKGYYLTPASFAPPMIKTITLECTSARPATTPDHVLGENDFVVADATDMLSPFQPMADTQPTLYLGFQQPGAATGFANQPVALYCDVAALPYDSQLGFQPHDEPAAVVWEYRTASGWSHLAAHDETQNFTRPELATFLGPPDFVAASGFGRQDQLFWLRARWQSGQYTYLPRMGRILTNTTWAKQATTIQNEVLGSSTGEPNQVFHTAKTPVLPGQRLEVREPELPSATERADVEAAEGPDAISSVSAAGQPPEIWVRWHAVPDFYASGPRSRHYTIDRLSGEIGFGNNRQGLVPPQGRANVRMASYQAGGGSYGNRPAGTITQLKRAVPSVDSVTNVLPAEGGADQESLDSVTRRVPRSLRHGGRAVAIADFEDLAFEASPEVARARGIPASNSTNAGKVALIVVPGDAVQKPTPSVELLGRVQDYIVERLTPTVDLQVCGPQWQPLSVIATVVPESLEVAVDVQTAILARLATFLHPLTGGPDGCGWEFGCLPYPSDLYALIQRTRGVRYVRSLSLVPSALPGPAPDLLIYSGDHQITLRDETAEPGF